MTIITHAEYPEDRTVLAEMRPVLLSDKGLLMTPKAHGAGYISTPVEMPQSR